MSKILLIDDDEDMLEMTGRWLEKAGYSVLKAASGSEALDLLSQDKPDLILLDYAMPKMNGPEVLQSLKSDDNYTNIPVLYRTGMDDTNLGDDGLADGVVPKAEGKPGLLKAVGNVLL